jgi:RNA polymerase sigma-70 factor, ECF subfamily
LKDKKALLDECRRTWPTVQLTDDDFLAYASERLQRDGEALALHELQLSDLWLACACTRGDPQALEQLESKYMPVIKQALRRIDAGDADDLAQTLRAALLVGGRGDPPRLLRYSGRGGLANWLRVVAVREALMRARIPVREVPEESGILERVAAEDDPELELARARYAPKFKAAFQTAFASLDDREKLLLRYTYVDGLTSEEVARIFRTHRSTITRHLAKIRESLLERTRSHLSQDRDLGGTALESVIRLLQGEMEVSLHRLLEGEEEP